MSSGGGVSVLVSFRRHLDFSRYACLCACNYCVFFCRLGCVGFTGGCRGFDCCAPLDLDLYRGACLGARDIGILLVRLGHVGVTSGCRGFDRCATLGLTLCRHHFPCGTFTVLGVGRSRGRSHLASGGLIRDHLVVSDIEVGFVVLWHSKVGALLLDHLGKVGVFFIGCRKCSPPSNLYLLLDHSSTPCPAFTSGFSFQGFAGDFPKSLHFPLLLHEEFTCVARVDEEMLNPVVLPTQLHPQLGRPTPHCEGTALVNRREIPFPVLRSEVNGFTGLMPYLAVCSTIGERVCESVNGPALQTRPSDREESACKMYESGS
eukprot:m.115908 g.115908  ORF g.115908 m.115908 type:complete len:318 (-) comp21598_c0_seq1:86-1039(-)